MIEELLTHSEWVRRLARSLAGDDATADDLVQETWIAASRRPPQLDRPVRPWLAVVVRNLFLKRLARERRREAHHDRIAVDASGVAGPSPEAALESAQLERLLAELVAALDEPYRQTLVLHYFEYQSAAEIARTLGVPAGTVRWRLKMARDELRQVLDRRHAGDREVWRRALLPLFPASSPRAPDVRIDRVPVALGVVGLVVAAALVRNCAREPVSTAQSRAEPSAPAAAGPRPPATGAAAGPARLDAEQCRSAVTGLRREVAIAEHEHLLRLDGEERFRLGEANPVAQQVMAPIIARMLTGDGAAAPSHSLDCKTWSCRLLLLRTAQELVALDPWQQQLRTDPNIIERLDSFLLSTAAPTKDPVSKVPLYEEPVYLALADPSGQRMPRPRPVPEATTAPLPSTLESCGRELALLNGRLAAAREGNSRADSTAPRGDWIAVVERRSKELEAQGKSEACVARFPGRGTLEVRFEPSAARSSERHVVARYGGSLAGTPLGDCLTETIVEPILSTPMPDPPLVDGVAFYPIVIR